MRHQPGLCAKPVALIEEQEKKPVIIQLNDVAEKAGIYKGMTPSQALARSLRVVIKVRARTQEKSIQEILLHYAFTLSPFVEATAPGICTVQFTTWHRHPADASRAGSPCHEVEDETGDLLFAVVNLARKCKLDAESALQGATNKFVARFNRLEDELQLRGKKLGDVDLAEMDKIWNQIKETPNAEPPTPSAEAF